ncbi:MAG: molybdopterin-guanine dinucleotide biosynthesis protein B [Lachnospiraceae bacterium]|nr:molybdopterin-guanine dinucleotide biosynthesis protein B [Lachnospiraceae bacterium]
MSSFVMGISGFSGSGKTTLIEKMIPVFKERGFKVAVIKHDGHDFSVDKEGKDTYRFSASGADTVMISSEKKYFKISYEPRSLEDMIGDCRDCDVIFVEGYKYANIEKIGISSKRTDHKLPCEPGEYAALVTDGGQVVRREYESRFLGPVFDIDDICAITDFLFEKLKDKTDINKGYRIGAAILIGGHSRRMGRPKDGIVIEGDGRTFLEKICDETDACYAKCIDKRYLSMRREQAICREGYTNVYDEYDDKGPLSGIISVLKQAKRDGVEAVLVLAVDMINYDKKEIEGICRAYRGEDVFFSRTGQKDIQPLAAIYNIRILKRAISMADSGNYRIRDIITNNINSGYYDSECPEAYVNVNSLSEGQ